MCLIISGKSNQIRNTLLATPGLVQDIYDSNSDGIGAMYTTSKGKLRTPKLIPKNVREFAGFIKQLPNDERNIAIHARYKTHGDIDLENCHPYPVLKGRIAMMHNGVLSQGNKADPTKSDTWHYINDVVRPQLEKYPKLFTLREWIALIEEDITSSNRFVFMDDDGELVIANEDTGITHDGMWFSNTYAWSPELLIPGYYVPPKFNRSQWMDSDWGWGNYYRGSSAVAEVETETVEETTDAPVDAQDWANDAWECIADADVEYLALMLVERPYLTLRSLFAYNEFVCSVEPTELSAGDYEYVKLMQDEQVTELADKIINNDAKATKVAEVACWYGDWPGKPINSRDDTQADAIAALAAQAADDALDAGVVEAANEAYAG